MHKPVDEAPVKPHSGRRAGTSSTRDDIVRAAQKLFAERGYHGATMRAIASEARVDPALIHHFFTSKEGVFSAAIKDFFKVDQIVEEVLQPDGAGVGYRLISSFMGLWDRPETQDPILAVVRSATSYEAAVQLFGDCVVRQVISRIVEQTASSHQSLRTTLIGAEIVGLIMMRYVFKIEPLDSAPNDVIALTIGRTIDRYLTEDLDVPADYQV